MVLSFNVILNVHVCMSLGIKGYKVVLATVFFLALTVAHITYSLFQHTARKALSVFSPLEEDRSLKLDSTC